MTRPDEEGRPWPLRRVLRLNERIARATFRPSSRAREFATARAVEPRINGGIGLDGARADRLRLFGGLGGVVERVFTMNEIKALPRSEQTTELKCIEGWSAVVHWAGVRLADLAAASGLASRSGTPYDPARPPADLYEYVSLSTPDGSYYVGLDAASALHAQTLLCHEMNGLPLTPGHGAPLRLVIPLKYGVKNLKNLAVLRFTDARPADYWAERGYDWYAGH